MTQDGTETKHIVYSYDKNNRLLSETLISETTEIADTQTAVSETGNKKITTITETRVRTITEETIKTYTYDPNGNTLTITSEDSVIAYTYNARNQQISYSLNGATMATYTYNPDGLRRSKHVLLTLEQRYIWSGGSMVYECELLYPANGTVYVYGINLISARNSSGDDTFYLYNAHGDVVQLVDGGGDITQTYNYDAFGVEYDIDEDDDNYIRYAGQYYDTETGTYYLRARYYNPANGRFTQQDGWAYAEANDTLSLNLYTYCRNNPVMYIDISGNKDMFNDSYGYMNTDSETGDTEAVDKFLSLNVNKIGEYSNGSVYVIKMEDLPSDPEDREALLDELSGQYGVIVVDDRQNLTNPNIQIYNSANITDKKEMYDILALIINYNETSPVYTDEEGEILAWDREINDLYREWYLHNVMYSFSFNIDSTKSADLDMEDKDKGFLGFVFDHISGRYIN